MAALPLPAVPQGQHLSGCEERAAWSREALQPARPFSLASVADRLRLERGLAPRLRLELKLNNSRRLELRLNNPRRAVT